MKKIKLSEIAQLAVITALMVAGKESLNALPNIHPVAVLLLLTVIFYGWYAMLPATAFALIEVLLQGFGLWNLMYQYMWPLLVIAAIPLRKSRKWILWAILAACHGFTFGLLCAIPYAVIGGLQAAIAFWIVGIPYDLIHGTSNFILTLILLPRLYELMLKINKRNG